MFKQDIIRSIGKVLKNEHYQMIPLDSRCIYFAKRYSDKLAFYVRCADNRCVNGTVDVKYFLAPIRNPDDSIIRMNLGVHIQILEVNEDEYTDEIMEAAGKKIISLEKKTSRLFTLVNAEIESPYFPSGLTRAYKNELLIYDVIMNEVKMKEDIITLKNKLCESIKKKKRIPTYDMCREIIMKFSPDYFQNAGINKEIDEIIDIFLEQLWAQCELDA